MLKHSFLCSKSELTHVVFTAIEKKNVTINGVERSRDEALLLNLLPHILPLLCNFEPLSFE